MKVQCDETGGRILLGDNTNSGTFKLLPIGFHGFGVWISTGLSFIYIHTLVQVYAVHTDLKFDLHMP